MTINYVRSKIKEALAATSGDKRDAQKLLITWAVRDQPLLLGLTKTHLQSITATWIDQEKKSRHEAGQVVSRHVGEKRTAKVPPPKTSMRQASVMRQIVEAFKKK